MSETTQWITFILIGLGTFAIRLSFIELHTVLRIPHCFAAPWRMCRPVCWRHWYCRLWYSLTGRRGSTG